MHAGPGVAAAGLLGALAGPNGESRRLLQVAQAHGLLPQLGRLNPDWLRSVPPDELDRLTQQHAHRCLRLTRELIRLLDVLDRHGVQAIPFKGPVLAVQLYGDPAARCYQDIDFLVRDTEADRALSVLVANGYEPEPEVRRHQLRRWRGWLDHCRLTREGTIVELHWGLDQRGLFSLDLHTARTALDSVRLGGRTVRTLSREHLVLYLAAHGAKHAWQRLEWILDFGELVRTSPNLDWRGMADAARARGAERALRLALRLARDLAGVAPPENFAAPVAEDMRVSALARDVGRSLRGSRPLRPGSWTLETFHLRVQERLRDRVRYLARLLFASGPADWALLPLPVALSWLHALVRPLRLGVEVTTPFRNRAGGPA